MKKNIDLINIKALLQWYSAFLDLREPSENAGS